MSKPARVVPVLPSRYAASLSKYQEPVTKTYVKCAVPAVDDDTSDSSSDYEDIDVPDADVALEDVFGEEDVSEDAPNEEETPDDEDVPEDAPEDVPEEEETPDDEDASDDTPDAEDAPARDEETFTRAVDDIVKINEMIVDKANPPAIDIKTFIKSCDDARKASKLPTWPACHNDIMQIKHPKQVETLNTHFAAFNDSSFEAALAYIVDSVNADRQVAKTFGKGTYDQAIIKAAEYARSRPEPTESVKALAFVRSIYESVGDADAIRLISDMSENAKPWGLYSRAGLCTVNNRRWFIMLEGKCDRWEGQILIMVIAPLDYPANPPAFYMMTPNGMAALMSDICVSIGKYHKDKWAGSYGIQGIMQSVHSSICYGDITSGIGIKNTGDRELINRLAKESFAFNEQHYPQVIRLVRAGANYELRTCKMIKFAKQAIAAEQKTTSYLNAKQALLAKKMAAANH